VTSRNWKDVVEIVGIAAIIASLIFVGLQLRQEQQIAISEIEQADEGSSTRIDLAIVENADLWLKANNGEILTGRESLIMNRLVAAMYRRARLEAIMRKNLGQFGPVPIIDFAIELHENPGARSIWEEQAKSESNYYRTLLPNDDFRQSYLDEVFEKLQSLDKASL